MPAKLKNKPHSTKAVTVNAKREAVVQAYGCHPVEADMVDFYFTRRHLAKADYANERGWRELKYREEEEDLLEAVEKTLRAIRDRDGVKYFREVAKRLLANIAINVGCHAG